jgi:catechol 2,3-dioxygenase-like lactoylglutathione lyase family enzyme
MNFKLQEIDHIVLRSDDIEAMLAFYGDVLGASLERHLEAEGLYQLRAGRSLIDIVDTSRPLGQAGGAAPDGHAPNVDHFCLTIHPWHEVQLRAHLEQHGVSPSPVARRYGAQGYGPSLYIQDPSGNTIELKASAADSPG